MKILAFVALGALGIVAAAAPASGQQTAPLVKRDVVVRLQAYSGTEELDWGTDYQVSAAAKESPELKTYIESQIESWGYVTESEQRAQTSACITVNGKCESVGAPRDFDWSHAKNVDIDVYVRYKGAASMPASIDIDFRNNDPTNMFSDHWRTHVSVHHWDSDLRKALDKLHRRMDSGK